MLGCPVGNVPLEFGQVLALSNIRLGLKCQGIVEVGELRGLVDLPEAYVGGLGRDALSDFLGERLVGVRGGG